MTVASVNPFSTSGPVRPPNFISRKKLIDEVASRITTDECTWITGLPRSGKSSLINHLFSRDNHEDLFRKSDKSMIFSRIDLNTFPKESSTPGYFWEKVLTPLEKELQKSETLAELREQYELCRSREYALDELKELLQRLRAFDHRLVVLLDNFGHVNELSLLCRTDFFANLREISQDVLLPLVVASNYEIHLLCKKLENSGVTSSYFSQFQEMILKPLQYEEMNQILKLAQNRFSHENEEFIRNLTGGHPFLLQAAAQNLWKMYDNGIQDIIELHANTERELHQTHHAFFDDVWRICMMLDAAEGLTCIALINENIKLSKYYTESNEYFFEQIHNFTPELDKLSRLGLLKKDSNSPSGWKIEQPIILTWLEEELITVLRRVNEEDSFGQWLNDGFYENEEEDEKVNEKEESEQNGDKYMYYDVALRIGSDRRIQISTETGDQTGELQLGSDKLNQLNLALQLIENGKTNEELFKSIGIELYDAIFPIDIRSRLSAAKAVADTEGKGIRIRLEFDELQPELAALPWEFLYDDETNTFLANDKQTALSRYIGIPLPKKDIVSANPPLKILLIIAEAKDLAPLDVDIEESLIRSALNVHIEAGQIELDVLREATIRKIDRSLQETEYNVVHFIGHGVFENNSGAIALVDSDGNHKLLNDQGFANLFLGHRNLGMIVLNACQGATVSSNQVFAGVAPRLVQRGIPAVVAMQYPILDTTAKLFADQFYSNLALGQPVDAAIQSTRNLISIEVGLDQPDFATPVLYMRAKDGVVLSRL